MELTEAGRRVLGALVEKAMATPGSYPLSNNALQAACNQLTARDPVVAYDEPQVRAGLDDLKRHELVVGTYARGGRTVKWEHRLNEQCKLDDGQAALLAVLMLRGAQTIGELRARTDRMHGFDDLADVDRALQRLATHSFGPFAVEQPRQPGQKETRWVDLLTPASPAEQAPVIEDVAPVPPPRVERPASADDELRRKIRALERDVGELREDLRSLRKELGAS